MPRVTDSLRDAQILAEFSILEPDKVEYFRNNYPDFVPSSWWDYDSGQPWNDAKLDGKLQWQITQVFLSRAWASQFKIGVWSLVNLLRLIFNADSLFTTIAERFMREPYPNGFPEGTRADFAEGRIEFSDGRAIQLPPRPRFGYGDENEQEIPMQRAIVYLFENPWRARLCAECNKRFVAAEPKNKFCSESCSHENRNRQKRKWWNKNMGKDNSAKRSHR
jgi:hypothetical protein